MQLTHVEGNPLPCFWLNEPVHQALLMALSYHWGIAPTEVEERVAYRVTPGLPDELIALNEAARALLDELATASGCAPWGQDANHIRVGNETTKTPGPEFLLKLCPWLK